MLAAAVATWRKAEDDSDTDDGSWEAGGACPPLRMPRDLAAGLAVGFLTGFFGVGGGFLIVPTLAVALAFTMRTAVGTSLAIITATSLLGLATHLAAGRDLDLGITLPMTAACVAGALGVSPPPPACRSGSSVGVSPSSSRPWPATCSSPSPSSAARPAAELAPAAGFLEPGGRSP